MEKEFWDAYWKIEELKRGVIEKLRQVNKKLNQLQEDYDLLLDVVASQGIVPTASLMPAIERAQKRIKGEEDD